MTRIDRLEALLQIVINHNQPEVAEALLGAWARWTDSHGLDVLRERLARVQAGARPVTERWPPGVYVPVVVRRVGAAPGDPFAVLVLPVVSIPRSAMLTGPAASANAASAEFYRRLVGQGAAHRQFTLELVGRGILGATFEDMRSAHAALLLARLLASSNAPELSRPVIVTGDVVARNPYLHALEIDAVDRDTLETKLLAALAVPNAIAFYPGVQSNVVSAAAAGAMGVVSVAELFQKVSSYDLPPLPEDAIELGARKLQHALLAPDADESDAAAVAEAASAHLATLAAAGSTDQNLCARLWGILGLALSRAGRSEEAEGPLRKGLGNPHVADPDVRCQLVNILALTLLDRGAFPAAVELIDTFRAEVAEDPSRRTPNDQALHGLCGTELLARSLSSVATRSFDAVIAARLDEYRAHHRCEPLRRTYYESLVYHLEPSPPGDDPALTSVFGRSLSCPADGPRAKPTIYALVGRFQGLSRRRRFAAVIDEYHNWLNNPGQDELEAYPTQAVEVLWMVVRASAALGQRAQASFALHDLERTARGSNHDRSRCRAAALALAVANGAGPAEVIERVRALADSVHEDSVVRTRADALVARHHEDLPPAELAERVNDLLDLVI